MIQLVAVDIGGTHARFALAEVAGGKVVHFDRVEWKIIPDTATAAAALQAGEVDWYEWIQADMVPLFRKSADIRLGTSHRLGIAGILRFNHLQPPFDNVAIRRAISGVAEVYLISMILLGSTTCAEVTARICCASQRRMSVPCPLVALS